MNTANQERPTTGVCAPDPSFTRLKNQFLMVFIVNILAFGDGCNVGWYSPALPVINTVPSPLLDGPISTDTAGWIGSFLAIGATTGCLGFGLLANWIGYKRSLLLGSIPLVISWLCIIFGVYAWQILLSRFLSGLTAGAVYACIPQFVAEIASDHIRGQLNSYVQIAFYSGILCGYIGGSFIPYNINPIFMIFIPIIFFIGCVTYVPESPQFLLKTNKTNAAEKSLCFYRNTYDTDDKINKSLLTEEFHKFQSNAKQAQINPPLRFSDFVTPKALKAMMICPFLMTVSQCSGGFAISNYAQTIFKETGSTVDPQISAIVMASFQVIGNYTASQLMDKVGRKVLLLVSLSGGIIALLVTSVFSYLVKHDYDVSAWNWVPLVSITFYVFICAIGILPVPYVMLSEVIPRKIRRIATTICTGCVFVIQSIMLRLMPLLLSTFQLYGSMWLFACVAVIGLIFTIVVVKETKGKNLDVHEVSVKS